MTDGELVTAFETASLPGERFDHAAHVRVGWWYVTHHPIDDAIARFGAALRRFAAAKGAPDKYHQTMTVAWLLIIADRVASADRLDWTTFAARHPDLLTNRPSVLSHYYSEDVLQSPLARQRFVMPDCRPAPSGWAERSDCPVSPA